MSDPNDPQDPPSDSRIGAERRREARHPVTLVVDYDDASDLVSDYTENLSSGGTFIYTERVLERGTKIELRLSFPELLQPIRISGEVRWCRRGPDPGIGVEFVNQEAQTVEALDRVVQAVLDRDPRYVARLFRILIVDDNPHVAQLIRDGIALGFRGLKHLVFDVRTRMNGKDAIAVLAEETFQALITDIYMPILDGEALIRHVRGDDTIADLPILAISAGGEAARVAALGAGANQFLEKPMRLRQVVASLRELLKVRDE